MRRHANIKVVQGQQKAIAELQQEVAQLKQRR
jgi:hypothetical protein